MHPIPHTAELIKQVQERQTALAQGLSDLHEDLGNAVMQIAALIALLDDPTGWIEEPEVAAKEKPKPNNKPKPTQPRKKKANPETKLGPVAERVFSNLKVNTKPVTGAWLANQLHLKKTQVSPVLTTLKKRKLAKRKDGGWVATTRRG